MRESDAVMSAIPYYFNLDLARLAVEAGAHFCDLGGNTEIVFKQKELDAEAKRKNITVVPDCGLAPGMVNILAQHGIEQLDTVDSVKIFVGGLPQAPEPPLNYMLVYSSRERSTTTRRCPGSYGTGSARRSKHSPSWSR